MMSLIKNEKVSVQLKINVTMKKYKNICTSLMFNNLAPTTREIKNEESIQVFNPQIVDARETGQYMPDDRSDCVNQINFHGVNINSKKTKTDSKRQTTVINMTTALNLEVCMF